MFDRTSFNSRGSKVHLLQAQSIDTKTCHVPGIAHNKIIIIDERIVITSSYNFTKTENYVMLKI